MSIAVGWGGVAGKSFRASGHLEPGTAFAYALGGDMATPQFAAYPNPPLLAGVKYDPADVEPGAKVYVNHCAICHGTPGANTGGAVPNLGHADAGVINNLKAMGVQRPVRLQRHA